MNSMQEEQRITNANLCDILSRLEPVVSWRDNWTGKVLVTLHSIAD